MKRIVLTTVIGIIMSNIVFSQKDMTKYTAFIKKADSLHNAEFSKNSAIEYQNAFDSNEGDFLVDDRYNAACTFALAGDSGKAFYHLFYCAEHPTIKYNKVRKITSNPDFLSLYEDEKWKMLIQLVKANKTEAQDLAVRLGLTKMQIQESEISRISAFIQEKFGPKSDKLQK